MAKRLYFKDYYYLQGNNVHIHGVGSLKVPSGNTTQRPGYMTSNIRYNHSTNSWELGLHDSLVILNDNGTSTYLDREGGTLTGDLSLPDSRIKNGDGTYARPSYSFAYDEDTGIYRSGDNTVDIVVGADLDSTQIPVLQAQHNTTSTSEHNQLINVHGDIVLKGNEGVIYNTIGTHTRPSYSFENDKDTGLFQNAEGSISIVVDGELNAEDAITVKRNVDSTSEFDYETEVYSDVVFYGYDSTLQLTNGSYERPSMSFHYDQDSGIYRKDINSLDFVVGGSLDTTEIPIINIRKDNSSISEHGQIIEFNGDLRSKGSSGVIEMPVGTYARPTYTFNNDTDTGIYRSADNTLDVVVGSDLDATSIPVLQAQHNSNSTSEHNQLISVHGDINLIGQQSVIYNTVGAHTRPSYSFSVDKDTGIYQSSPDTIDVVVSGDTNTESAIVVSRNDNSVSEYNQEVNFYADLHLHGNNSSLLLADGTYQNPSLTFKDDTDSGLYRKADNSIDFVVGTSQDTSEIPVVNIRKDASSTSEHGQIIEFNGDLVTLGDSGVIKMPSGSHLEPSYTFNNDTDTGIFRSSEDTLDIVVGSSMNASPVMRARRDSVNGGEYDQVVEVYANLIIRGETTQVSTNELQVEDDVIVLNKNGTDFGESGIDIEADSATAASFLYNFSSSHWHTDGANISVTVAPVNDSHLTNKEYVDTELETVRQALQDELDTTQLGVGVDTDGNYIVSTTSRYIDTATSTHNATEILDQNVGRLDDDKTDKTTQVIAGNGLVDGGDLSQDVTVTMGTPSTITISSTNAVTAESHTHELDITLIDLGATVYTTDLLTSPDAATARDKLDLGTVATYDVGLLENEVPLRTVDGNIDGDLNGNADTATQLETARTISLSGDAQATGTFDGTGDLDLVVTIADDSHNHVISNIDGLQTALDSKLDETAKAADSELLDGFDSTQFLRSDESDILEIPSMGLGAGMILEADTVNNGLVFRPDTDPASGSNIFAVKSSSGLPRLVVDNGVSIHSGNADMYLGTDSDGNNGDRVFHEGYHPNADQLTNNVSIELQGSVLGTVSTDFSGNTIINTTLSENYYTETEVDTQFSDRKWTVEQSIASGAQQSYDLNTTFGTLISDVREVTVDIKVLDTESGSPTENMWIDAAAVATYGINTTSGSLVVINEFSSSLTFFITLKV